MLNETWLKKSDEDRAVIEDPFYDNLDQRISARKGAEIVALEITLNDKKFVFCTVYRVNNLGKINQASIMNTIKTFNKSRNPRIFYCWRV